MELKEATEEKLVKRGKGLHLNMQKDEKVGKLFHTESLRKKEREREGLGTLMALVERWGCSYSYLPLLLSKMEWKT